MERGQATIEYAALGLLVCVGACILVTFHTPVEQLARQLARALDGRPPKPRITGRPHPHRGPSARADHPCLCPLDAGHRAGRAHPKPLE
jgi:hypothetical protein